MNIGIISYGSGNVYSFANSFDYLNIPFTIIKEAADFTNVSHLILPGVGTFDDVIIKLKDSKLLSKIEYYVHNIQIPFLGVCSGMQVLFDSSEEGNQKGLGWIQGTVLDLSLYNTPIKRLKIPHLGWNNVFTNGDNFFSPLNNNEFYFLHSYYCKPNFNLDSYMETHYGSKFISAFNYKNIFATQFHPEKSHQSGLNLLRNFANFK